MKNKINNKKLCSVCGQKLVKCILSFKFVLAPAQIDVLTLFLVSSRGCTPDAAFATVIASPAAVLSLYMRSGLPVSNEFAAKRQIRKT